MRPGNQNNKRMRGRGRKGPNPLTRAYESNGPDVKIRGTALHIAEKYQQLARDAHASGDRVMSENYYQHSEHYLRIVAAAQSQSQLPVMLPRNDDGDDDDIDTIDDRREREVVSGLQPTMPLDAPQPFIDRMPGINTKQIPTVNGQAETEDGARSEDDGGSEDSRMRRRSRGARGRGMRRERDASTDQGGDGWQKDGSDRSDAEQLPASLIARSRSEPSPVSEPHEAPAKPAPAGEPDQDAAASEKKPRARRPARSRSTKADKSDSEAPATTEA